MPNREMFFKRWVRDDVYHYARLLCDRRPPMSERINLLNDMPIIEQRDYDLNDPGSRIEYDAFFEAWNGITAEEFKQAFSEATASDFKIYINGKPMSL